MDPQPYLSKEGKRIFEEIAEFLTAQGMAHEIDSFELSMLANAFDMHAKASKEIAKHGATRETPNKYTQVSPEYTVWKQTGDYITKHSEKFLISPGARGKKGVGTKTMQPTDKKTGSKLKQLKAS